MEKYRLHTGWTFCLDERNEKEETAPSEGFRAVTLPHDWSTDYPFDPESDTCGSGGYAKAGIGWYQRTITISNLSLYIFYCYVFQKKRADHPASSFLI